jgi:hypothetical protein
VNAPFGHSLPRCPYCLGPVLSWPAAAVIEPCWSCRRPIVNIKHLARYSQRPRLHGLFGIISASYGLAVVALVASFAFTGMDARQFAKIFTLLLFVIGSVLGVDGVLAVTTGVDRTWDCRRSGIAEDRWDWQSRSWRARPHACRRRRRSVSAGIQSLLITPAYRRSAGCLRSCSD